MAVITYGNFETSLDKSTEAYEYLQEINEKLGKDKLIIAVTDIISGRFPNPNLKVGERYSIYWNLGKGEYQHIMAFKKLDYQAVECYLLGILTGLDKSGQ